jgi:hypothetical protein
VANDFLTYFVGAPIGLDNLNGFLTVRLWFNAYKHGRIIAEEKIMSTNIFRWGTTIRRGKLTPLVLNTCTSRESRNCRSQEKLLYRPFIAKSKKRCNCHREAIFSNQGFLNIDIGAT